MVTRVRVGDLVQRRFVDVGRSYYARLMGVELEQQDPDLVLGDVREVLPDGRVRVRFDLMDRDTILKPEDVDVVAVPRWEGVLAKAPLGVGDVVVTTWESFGERMARYHVGEVWNQNLRVYGTVLELVKRSAWVAWTLPPTPEKSLSRLEKQKLSASRLRKLRPWVSDPSDPALVKRALRILNGSRVPRPPPLDRGAVSAAVVDRLKHVEVELITRSLSSGGKSVALPRPCSRARPRDTARP